MIDRPELELNIATAKTILAAAVGALAAFEALAVNNVFANLEDAADLEDTLADRAHDDCKGAGNCGRDEYLQAFLVDGIEYVAIYEPEYNRHDKTYYYVDGSEFRIEPVVK